MPVDTHVYHILTVTGHSANSFDEATKNAIEGGWQNHHEEFESFVSFDIVKMFGGISMENGMPVATYSSTVAISAIHRPHDH